MYTLNHRYIRILLPSPNACYSWRVYTSVFFPPHKTDMFTLGVYHVHCNLKLCYMRRITVSFGKKKKMEVFKFMFLQKLCQLLLIIILISFLFWIIRYYVKIFVARNINAHYTMYVITNRISDFLWEIQPLKRILAFNLFHVSIVTSRSYKYSMYILIIFTTSWQNLNQIGWSTLPKICSFLAKRQHKKSASNQSFNVISFRCSCTNFLSYQLTFTLNQYLPWCYKLVCSHWYASSHLFSSVTVSSVCISWKLS